MSKKNNRTSAPRKPRQSIPQSKTHGMVRQQAGTSVIVSGSSDLEARADYDFARASGDRTDVPRSSGEAIGELINRRRGDVVRMSRYATRMNGLAKQAIDVRASYAIGTGIRPSVPDDGEGLIKLWNRWTKHCGSDGIRDFYMFQDKAYRERASGGEAFTILRYREDRPDLAVPLQIQLLSTEFLPTETEFLKTADRGVVYNKYREPVAYHFYKDHPGSRSELVASSRSETFRVPADNVVHTLLMEEVGARRGMPLLARALQKIHDVEKYLDAELVKKVLSSNIAYAIEMPDLTEEEKEALADIWYNPTNGKYYNSDKEEVSPPPSQEVVTAPKSGTVFKVPRGGEIKQIAPAESGNSFAPFVRQLSLHLAAAVGVPLEYLLGDMQGINDRLFKGVSQQFERSVKVDRRDFNAEFNTPIWNAFVRLAVSEGKWKVPAGRTMEEFLDPEWVGQPFPNLHRAQEVSSWKQEVDEGFATRSDIHRRNGEDPERIRRERLDDLKRDILSGLTPIPEHWTDKMITDFLGWSGQEVDEYRSRTAPAKITASR
jgi:lambda family phage portal protein